MKISLFSQFTFVAFGLLAGCSSTRQSTNQELSGFLMDYERLERPESGRAAFWANPSFELSDYDAIQVAEVEIWDSTKRSDGIVQDDAVRLANMLRERTVAKLEAAGWRVVEEGGPRVAHLRMALTELNGANRFGNILTSMPYMTTPAIKLVSAASDIHVFVGKASTELQILDSANGTVLAEAYDRRVGAHALSNIGSTWGDVEDSLEIFASRIAEGLAKENS